MGAAELVGLVRSMRDTERILGEYRRARDAFVTGDRAKFASDFLCALCRTLVKDGCKVSEPVALVSLSAEVACDVAKETGQSTQTLAAVLHLHRFAAGQNVNADVLFKLSGSVLKSDLLAGHYKTYWIILQDTLVYLEKLNLKTESSELLIANVTHYVEQVIGIYSAMEFCKENLLVLIKRLFRIFSDSCPKELNKLYGKIFNTLSNKCDTVTCDVKESVVLDVFIKINESFVIIVDNSSKCDFEKCALNKGVILACKLFNNKKDAIKCINSLYGKFCKMFEENVTKSLKTSLENICTALRTDTSHLMKETVPYFSQLIRTDLEVKSKVDLWKNLTKDVQKAYLKLIFSLIVKLKSSPQVLKCAECKLKSGLHDSVRLSFTVRSFLSMSVQCETDSKETLDDIIKIFAMQTEMIKLLQEKKCANFEKCRLKSQTDIHNSAIILHRHNLHKQSIVLFNMYIASEISNGTDKTSLSRAFYNKAICELDMKLYSNALKSAYLSYALAGESTEQSNKIMRLVIDVKSRASKGKQSDEPSGPGDEIQMTTVLDSCEESLQSKEYRSLKPLLANVQFSVLLQKEGSCYNELWPSLTPLLAVCSAQHRLLRTTKDESEDILLSTLCETIVHLCRCLPASALDILADLIDRLRNSTNPSVQSRIHYCTLLLLKTEILATEMKTNIYKFSSKEITDMADGEDDSAASVDAVTLTQQLTVTDSAVEAIKAMTLLLPKLISMKSAGLPAALRSCLQKLLLTASVTVCALPWQPAHALQLAHLNCELATLLQNDVSLMRNAGFILEAAVCGSSWLEQLARNAGAARARQIDSADVSARETALEYTCQEAIYRHRCGDTNTALRLLHYVQLATLEACARGDAAGLPALRLLMARSEIGRCRNTTLTLLNSAHKLSLQLKFQAGSWWERRYRSSALQALARRAGCEATRGAARAGLVRRARVAAAAARGCALAAQPHVVWAAPAANDAQVRIDTLKYILGVTSAQTHTATQFEDISTLVRPMEKLQVYVDETAHVEEVLDVALKKSQLAPASPYFDVKAFSMPEFFTHLKTCQCHRCYNPSIAVISLEVSGLEAANKFRSNEMLIADNYFKGCLKMLDIVDTKVQRSLDAYRKMKYEKAIVETVKNIIEKDILTVKAKIMIEFCYFLLADMKYASAEKYCSNLLEMSDQLNDAYLKIEILNVACVLNNVKHKAMKKKDNSELCIESDLESLKLSPSRNTATTAPKTPSVKVPLPRVTRSRAVVTCEDIPAPVKRKVIKLNLDN